MSNIKFTTDGKKVVVIGSLNSQEKIVQEIFVVDGSEVPSGEHFVVKSLHDAPAVSWKESELKKLEDRYQKESTQYKSEIDKLYRSYKARTTELRERLTYAGAVLKNVNEKSFELLVDFITGEIEWVVVGHYELQLLSIDKFHQMYEDKLRLVSLFGKDDGSFSYAVGDYYDYSGSHRKFYPFKNYDDAILKLKELLLQQNIGEQSIKVAKEYGIELPVDKLNEYKQNKISEFNKNIDNYSGQIQKWKSSIEELAVN